MSFNLATMLRESTAAGRDRPLVHIADTTLTYGQVDAQVRFTGRQAA